MSRCRQAIALGIAGRGDLLGDLTAERVVVGTRIMRAPKIDAST